MTWFWWESGRAEAWRYMVEKFHQSQNEIRVEEAGWPFNEFTNNIIVQLQAGRIEGDLIQTTRIWSCSSCAPDSSPRCRM